MLGITLKPWILYPPTISNGFKKYNYWGHTFYGTEMLRYCLENDLNVNTIGLELFIDTSQVIGLMKTPIWARGLFYREEGEKEIMYVDDTLVKSVMAYPVFLFNKSDSIPIKIKTQDGSLEMICEVQDEKGNWKPIQYWSSSWCGNSYAAVNLPPKHILYMKFPLFKGEFKSKARLALQTGFGTLYSNEFDMSVNLGQFEKQKK